jgi:hypothetical protein
MHDAYSFDCDFESAAGAYELFREAYVRTFGELRLPIIISSQTDMGSIGGDRSHEFHVPSAAGDDTVQDGGNTPRRSLEVAHTFMLGTSYSEPMEAFYIASDGSRRPIYMCSYGLGIERTLAAYVENYYRADAKDPLQWSWALSPFQVMILGHSAAAFDAYRDLRAAGHRTLIDDRDLRFGAIMAEGLQFGFPIYVIAGSKSSAGDVEVRCPRLGAETTVSVSDLPALIESWKEQLECVELAECYGRCVSLDPAGKSAVVAFDEAWKLDAPFYASFDIRNGAMGRFGDRKPGAPIKRLRFGKFWITPVVAGPKSDPLTMQRRGDIAYVSFDGSDSELVKAPEFYRHALEARNMAPAA